LVYLQAQRLHVRTFGRLAVHRGTWTGPEVPIDKKRIRALVAYLAAHHTESISRDVLVDSLWPDADGDSAINSLNQAVFQLRRYFDAEYRAGTSPEYVLSNLDRVALNRELVRVDFDELLGLADQLGGLEPSQRNRTAHRLLDFVRGDYLSDFRYEDWATVRHTVAAITLRRALLPIATGETGMLESEVRLRAATALLRLDPYDEKAVIAMASAMAVSGKRVAARELVARYAERIRAEMDDEPSIELASTMSRLSVGT
jgi:DNA-binding SARP family transcriptional activator